MIFDGHSVSGSKVDLELCEAGNYQPDGARTHTDWKTCTAAGQPSFP
jgi:hypothetical protein